MAINTSGSMEAKDWAHLLKYDSVYGRLPYKISTIGPRESQEIGRIIINDHQIPVLAQRDPARIPWKKYHVDTVLECTGVFRDQKAEAHLKAGAKKVIISAPPKDTSIPIFILGVNETQYKGERLISNGSCTTNCVAPLVKIIDQEIGFQEAIMTTIHAYTSDQNIVDGSHSDPRRSRAAAQNIVPTTTGAAQSVVAAYPEVAGRFAATAIRVPVICGSYSDLTFKLVRKTTVEEVNHILEEAALDPRLIGRLKISYEPLVSSDIIGNTASCLVDTLLTKVVSDDLLQISAWYDNEYAYSCRLLELAQYIHRYRS
jgi:glyceraldehyde 3-phosphate dehydrogenase